MRDRIFQPIPNTTEVFCTFCRERVPGDTKGRSAHLVAEHGFTPDPYNDSAYMKRQCIECGKTAIYVVGHTGYCSAHKQLAIGQRARYLAKVVEPRANSIENQKNEIDRRLRIKTGADNMARGRRRPKA